MTTINFQQHLAEMMQWHFSATTGTPFWLEMRSQFNFDPLQDIRTFEDLALFPDVSLKLREIAIEDLQPRGLKNAEIAGIFESGGTTGTAKRIVVYQEWLTQLIKWRVPDSLLSKENQSQHTLAILPSGPHIVAAINRQRAQALGGHYFTVDLDPRWVKKLIHAGETASAKSYLEHLIDQAEAIIFSQKIAYLVATPPFLVALARRKNLVKYLNQTLKMITWGGTQMDVDTLDYLKNFVFPEIEITASYGSTMILSETKARRAEDHEGSPIFDSYAPYVLFDVVNPTTKKSVENYQRGQVVMHHLSKFALLPNIFERDTALRLPTAHNYPGAAVSAIKPCSEIAGQKVIEGVY